MIWTDDAVARLTAFLADPRRLSAAEIADKLGCGRGAVMGKVRRLGLKLQLGHGQHKNSKPSVPRRPKPKLVVTPPAPAHLSLFDLQPHHCRWPYGDGPFTFCGHDKIEGSSYCAAHARMSQRELVCEAA